VVQTQLIDAFDKAAQGKRIEIVIVRVRRMVYELPNRIGIYRKGNDLQQLVGITPWRAAVIAWAYIAPFVPMMPLSLPDQELALRAGTSRHRKGEGRFKRSWAK